VIKGLKRSEPVFVEPIPIKKLGDQVVFVDGHTRALAAFLLGLSEVPVYWEEDEELDWKEYEICVEWCKREGIFSISDLKNRIVPHNDYQALWLDRCRRMQQDLEAERKTRNSAQNENGATHSKLLAIKNKLQEAEVEWIIFAGAAASCYGSNREITDVDILVRCDDLEKARTALKNIDFAGFDVVCGAEIRTAQGACTFFLDDKMIERAKWRQLFGVLVPVVSVEDNILFKAILQRGEDEGKHDVEDIKSMIAHEKIDLQYLKERMQKCRAEKRVEQLLKSLIPSLPR
jgi:hypothetical protein